jgi:antitoxin (DNA-binding transcriptional repressor) of toxin-antitoxin stability system
MIAINIEEIHRDIGKYLTQVVAGETIVVMQENEAVAEIKPLPHHEKTDRPYGLAKGEFAVPDGFDDPLPDDILNAFEAAMV